MCFGVYDTTLHHAPITQIINCIGYHERMGTQTVIYNLENLEPTADLPRELQDLQQLRQAGLPIARIVIIPAAFEESFYRLNNLPEQLQLLFSHVDLHDPDEDDIEDIIPEAQALLKHHYLLDETIDQVYTAIQDLAFDLRVRRSEASGLLASRGRPALLALKTLWSADWSFEAIMQRLQQSPSIALEARPILIHAADEPVPSTLRKQWQPALPPDRQVWWQTEVGITRLGSLA